MFLVRRTPPRIRFAPIRRPRRPKALLTLRSEDSNVLAKSLYNALMKNTPDFKVRGLESLSKKPLQRATENNCSKQKCVPTFAILDGQCWRAREKSRHRGARSPALRPSPPGRNKASRPQSFQTQPSGRHRHLPGALALPSPSTRCSRGRHGPKSLESHTSHH